MGRSVLKINGYNSDQIKMLFRKDEKYTIGIRLYAIYQVSIGKPSRELEILYNTSFKQITNWVHRFEKEGIDGLIDKPKSGRKSQLNEEQGKTISQILKEKLPTEYGYNSATWTGPMLIDWIKKEFNIEFKKAQIYNIIKKLGFTYQKSKGIYPETDQQKQDEFKETLKKTARI
jgi:transposase